MYIVRGFEEEYMKRMVEQDIEVAFAAWAWPIEGWLALAEAVAHKTKR